METSPRKNNRYVALNLRRGHNYKPSHNLSLVIFMLSRITSHYREMRSRDDNFDFVPPDFSVGQILRSLHLPLFLVAMFKNHAVSLVYLISSTGWLILINHSFSNQSSTYRPSRTKSWARLVDKSVRNVGWWKMKTRAKPKCLAMPIRPSTVGTPWAINDGTASSNSG